MRSRRGGASEALLRRGHRHVERFEERDRQYKGQSGLLGRVGVVAKVAPDEALGDDKEDDEEEETLATTTTSVVREGRGQTEQRTQHAQ